MKYSIRLASVVVALAALGASGAHAFSLGTVTSAGKTFGNSFSGSTSGFTDYYTFTIANDGTVSGTTTDTSISFSNDVVLKSLVLTYGSMVLTQQAGSDTNIPDDKNSVNKFTFSGLTAGDYTLAVNGLVTGKQTASVPATYSGTIKATASVASAAPEPADMALTMMGLAGVGFMVRRRAAR
jgi:hypothetical protein